MLSQYDSRYGSRHRLSAIKNTALKVQPSKQCRQQSVFIQNRGLIIRRWLPVLWMQNPVPLVFFFVEVQLPEAIVPFQ